MNSQTVHVQSRPIA